MKETYPDKQPLNTTDPTGMDWYEFDENGNYSRRIAMEETHRMMTKSVDDEGNVTYNFYDFNDPDVDALSIDNGEITRMEFLSDNTVETMMNISGVQTDEARSSKWSYAYNNATRLMDYGQYSNFNKNTFYIRESIAYNVGDIGNYLWGRGMAELGFDLGTAIMGAHGNNAMFGRRQVTEKYYFGKDTYDGKNAGLWDSDGDQRAIMAIQILQLGKDC